MHLIQTNLSQLIIIVMQLPYSNKYIVLTIMQLVLNLFIEKIDNIT